MEANKCFWLPGWVILLILSMELIVTKGQKEYSMDEFATCGRTVNVDDSGVRLLGRGNASPSNPPLECIVYLRSIYSRDDGSNHLQIKVEAVVIRDCNVKVDLYNGRTSVGQTLQALSCQHSSTGLIYSTGPEVTVRFSRPDRIVHNEYQFTLEIKPYKDKDASPTQTGVDVLPVGAIIGLVIGCIVLIALIILFLWCCCTGRLDNFNIPGMSVSKARWKKGTDNKGIISEKSTPVSAINFDDPNVWNSTAPRTGLYEKGGSQNKQPMGRRFESVRDGNNRDSINRRSGHEYEPYDQDQMADEERKRREAAEAAWRRREEEKRREREKLQTREGEQKETLIDDVFDSDTNTKASSEESTFQERPPGSPKGSPKGGKKVPEEGDMDDAQNLQRYKSIDLQSQPDQDTISSPLHVNAGVRASVEDLESPSGSLRKKKGGKSPKAKRKGDGGREPDPMALPPEAFEPIFTAPITGIDYKGNQPQYGPGYPGGFVPYGLIPAGAFAPGPPGSQTYAYAYQTVPVGGMPYTQGAYIVQNTPTTDGNRRTAYAVEETVSPDKSRTTRDPFKKTAYRDSDRSKPGGKKSANRAPDLSVVARGAAPPDPGQGQRTIAMKSGTDPDSGIHTTQVVWTDDFADATDPKPNENPQITRKKVTRVTTKSGYGELPPQTMLLASEEEEPAFLTPSKSQQAATSRPAIMPAAQTPDSENVAFYTGDVAHHTVPPPERTSTPASMHKAPSYNVAIRDRIPMDDSTV